MVQTLPLYKANGRTAKALLETQLQTANATARGSRDLGDGDWLRKVLQDIGARATDLWRRHAWLGLCQNMMDRAGLGHQEARNQIFFEQGLVLVLDVSERAFLVSNGDGSLEFSFPVFQRG